MFSTASMPRTAITRTRAQASRHTANTQAMENTRARGLPTTRTTPHTASIRAPGPDSRRTANMLAMVPIKDRETMDLTRATTSMRHTVTMRRGMQRTATTATTAAMETSAPMSALTATTPTRSDKMRLPTCPPRTRTTAAMGRKIV